MMHLPSVPRALRWRVALSRRPHCPGHEKGALTIPSALETNKCHSHYRYGKTEARVGLGFLWATSKSQAAAVGLSLALEVPKR